MDNTRTYNEEEILALTLTIEHTEKSEDSFKWLMEHHCVELAALCDVLVFGKNTARKWLEKNEYTTLTTFLDALNDDTDDEDTDLAILLKGMHREWAAVISMVNDGDNNAEGWLIKNGLKYYAAFADTLSKKIDEKNTRKTALEGGVALAAVAAGSVLGEVAGVGFAGFGGGSFGGAGAAGLW